MIPLQHFLCTATLYLVDSRLLRPGGEGWRQELQLAAAHPFWQLRDTLSTTGLTLSDVSKVFGHFPATVIPTVQTFPRFISAKLCIERWSGRAWTDGSVSALCEEREALWSSSGYACVQSALRWFAFSACLCERSHAAFNATLLSAGCSCFWLDV